MNINVTPSAAEKITGAGTMALAATPVAAFKKSRRFMLNSIALGISGGVGFATIVPKTG